MGVNCRVERIWLYVGAFIFAVAYFALNFNSWRTYSTGGDFGLFMQAMNDPSGLLRNAVEGSHFRDHFSPIYDLFAPLVQTTHSVLPILALQAIAGALVSIGLFQIALLRLTPRLALATASVSLLYPPLAAVMFGDPYETCFAPAATIWLALFVLRRDWTKAVLVSILALAIKEDQAVFLTWAGAVAFVWSLRTRDIQLRRFSVALCIYAPLTLLLFLFVIRPAASADGNWAALTTALTDDSRTHVTLFNGIAFRLGYVAEMLVPLALLPLLAPRVLILALPAFAEVLMTPNSNVWDMGSHYAGSWVGYVLVAFVFGVARLRGSNPDLPRNAVLVAFALSALDLALASPTHWRVTVHRWGIHDASLDELIAHELPRGGTIGMAGGLYGHLWQQMRYQRGLRDSPCFVLIDTTVTDDAMQNKMSEQIADHRYGSYLEQWVKDGVVLYRRVGCSGFDLPRTRADNAPP